MRSDKQEGQRMKGGVPTFWHTSTASLARLCSALSVGRTCWRHFTKIHRGKNNFHRLFFFLWAKNGYVVNQCQQERENARSSNIISLQIFHFLRSAVRKWNIQYGKLVGKKKIFFLFLFFFPVCPGRAAANRIQLAKTHKRASPGKVHSGSIQTDYYVTLQQ